MWSFDKYLQSLLGITIQFFLMKKEFFFIFVFCVFFLLGCGGENYTDNFILLSKPLNDSTKTSDSSGDSPEKSDNNTDNTNNNTDNTNNNTDNANNNTDNANNNTDNTNNNTDNTNNTTEGSANHYIELNDIFEDWPSEIDEYLNIAYWRSYSPTKNKVTIEEWIDGATAPGQGFDAYGNYIFGAMAGMNNYRVSNLNKRIFVSTIQTEIDYIPARHANCQNFTTEFFLPEDDFPLLLVSGSESREGVNMTGESYLIRFYWDGYGFKASLVQTITTVPGTYTDANGNQFTFGKYSNIMVDRKSGHIFVICSSGIYEMNLPSLYDNRGNVISQTNLTSENIIRRIDFKYKTKYAQGACLHEGVAYIVDGISSNYLHIIDISTGERLALIRMADIGFNHELEDVTFWKGHMIICSGRSTGIYKVRWE